MRDLAVSARALFSRAADPPCMWSAAGGDAEPTGSVAANAAVRAALVSRGDDGPLLRDVSRYADPETTDALPASAMVEAVRIVGFVFFGPNGGDMSFVHLASVAPEAFDGPAAELFDAMEDPGGECDGWECPVVTGEGEGESR